jgi:acyl-CoA reductase-like NAD-dependent aldehyde dehydrogenase
MSDLEVHDSLWIGGSWVRPASDRVITVASPSTEEAIGRVPDGVEADVDAAVSAARSALLDPDGWSAWEPERRAGVLERLADRVAEYGDRFAELVSTQNGIPISMTRRAEAVNLPIILKYYADLIRHQPVEDSRPGMYGGSTIVRHDPVGVVAAIVPWNMPQTLLSFKLAPALAAGCSIVVKPAPETVLDAFLLAELLDESDVPPGVVSIVPGGRELGRYLVGHPGVDKVAFTGSSAAGRDIAQTCGRLLRPVTLELGGKSAAIVLDDADLAANVQALFGATMIGNGEICFLSTRVLAPQHRYAEVVDLLTSMAQTAVVGDALDEKTTVGPLVSAQQRERVERYISHGKSSGARLTTGGQRPGDRPRGWFVEPTVFADVDNSDLLAREEIFGPVLTVTRYTDEDDAVRLANDSDFGLSGIVFTQDRDHGLAVARRIETGTIGVNAYLPDLTAPFGGIKNSGLGRELGPDGLASYQQPKTIYVH